MTSPSLASALVRLSTPSLAAVALCSAVALGCDASAGADDDDTMGNPGGTPGTGGTPGVAGTPSVGGGGSTGSGGSAGSPVVGGVGFNSPMQQGTGSSTDQFATFPVSRNGLSYFFMANGWGPNFERHTVSWQGTSFTVNSMTGRQGPAFEPASYPTVFCGRYADKASGMCGLPAPISGLPRLRTGWRWSPNGNAGQYNAAYDIWLSNTLDVSGHSAYLMVWLRDPPGQQPAGTIRTPNVTVANVPGTWNLWVGQVSGRPYIAYVRAEGQDLYELEFDVMDFGRDAGARGVNLPGNNIISVAVGFEIWNGPVTNLISQDFYISTQ